MKLFKKKEPTRIIKLSVKVPVTNLTLKIIKYVDYVDTRIDKTIVSKFTDIDRSYVSEGFILPPLNAAKKFVELIDRHKGKIHLIKDIDDIYHTFTSGEILDCTFKESKDEFIEVTYDEVTYNNKSTKVENIKISKPFKVKDENRCIDKK